MKDMERMQVTVVLILLLGGCSSPGGTYTADGSAVLVQPTHRAWLKPGSTMEDENIARKECGEELRSNLELRQTIAKFHQEVKDGLRKESSKRNPDPWSVAYDACMEKRGFQFYRN